MLRLPPNRRPSAGSARRLGLALLVAALCVVVALRLSSSPSSERPTQGGYGLATAGANQGVSETVAACSVAHVPCPPGKLRLAPRYSGSSPAAAAWHDFRSRVLDPPGKGGLMRFWVPYDTLYSWNPSLDGGRGACSWSRYAFGPRARFNNVNGRLLFAQLVWNIQGALALDLTPEVVFSAGSGEGVPNYPDPGYGDRTGLFAGLTTAGHDYYCGVFGVMGWMRAMLGNSAPTQWEVFNEPDARGSYNGSLRDGCAVDHSCGTSRGAGYNHGGYLCGRSYRNCGALEAAELWQLAQAVAVDHGWGNEQIAALSATAPESAYAEAYIRQLKGMSSCTPGVVALQPGLPHGCATFGRFPRYWAVHDYDDPTAGGTADLQSFENALSALAARPGLAGGPISVWVTESGVEVSSQTHFDLNRHGCASGEPDANGTLGACVDGVPVSQARGAQVWRSLIDVSAPDVQTTEVFWFEFALISSWDSALVDSAGKPRHSFCALIVAANCDGDPKDYLMRNG